MPAPQNYTFKNWASADSSQNHLEVGEANESSDVIGIRSTFTPGTIVTCTRQQLINLATAVNTGSMRSLGLHS